jgi:hypothetical protein
MRNEEPFIPELMVDGFYTMCPKRHVNDPVKPGLTQVECPRCGRQCIVDMRHLKVCEGTGLNMACVHCLDPHKTPTPNNPPKY